MREYITFDSRRFLNESKRWTEQIKELELEKASITEIGGMSEGMPSGGNISRPTENVAIRRDLIQMKINEIYDRQACFLYAWERLSAADKNILTGFYYTPGFIHNFVEKWCAENASNRQYCYQFRREAEHRFGLLCEKWMEIQGYDV